MDKFLTLIDSATLRNIVAGAFSLEKVPPEKLRGIFLMAAHCCLNGPVGTNKVTTFPLIDEPTSISGYLGYRVSNSSWRGFCLQICKI
jgi:hypothetical protein